MEYKEAQFEIIKISKTLGLSGLVVGGAGNISSRLNENHIMISKRGSILQTASKEDFLTININGDVIDGIGDPTSEKDLHLEVYTKRPDVQAVVHTHSPYATVLAVLRQSIPPIVDEMGIILGGEVSIANYAQPGTKALAYNAVSALENRMGALLANHGVLAVGSSLEEALKVAKLIEHVAFIHLGALSSGLKEYLLPKDAIDNQIALFINKKRRILC